mgnify:CR=1 FL=1
MNEMIFSIVYDVLLAIVTGIVGYLGVLIKKVLDERLDTKQKKDVARDTARYVEQVCKDLDGAEKAEAFDRAAAEMLTDKGTTITDLELKVLREAAVNELNATDWKDSFEEPSEKEAEVDDED